MWWSRTSKNNPGRCGKAKAPNFFGTKINEDEHRLRKTSFQFNLAEIEAREVKPIPLVSERSRSQGTAFSLASAMRGTEDEETPYTLADIKEAFR